MEASTGAPALVQGKSSEGSAEGFNGRPVGACAGAMGESAGEVSGVWKENCSWASLWARTRRQTWWAVAGSGSLPEDGGVGTGAAPELQMAAAEAEADGVEGIADDGEAGPGGVGVLRRVAGVEGDGGGVRGHGRGGDGDHSRLLVAGDAEVEDAAAGGEEGVGVYGPLPAGAELDGGEGVVEVDDGGRAGFAGAVAAVDDGPAIGGPVDLIEDGFAADVDGAAGGVGVVEEVILPVGAADGGAVTGAAPLAVGGDEGVAGELLPGAEQVVGAGDAFGVAAVLSAAVVAGVEEVETAGVAEDVGAFDDAGLPRGVVGDELVAVAGEAEEIGREGLGPDGGGQAAGVAVFLPEQEGLAMFVAGETGVDGADGIAEDGAVVEVGTGGAGGGGERDAERAATLAGDVPGEEAAAVMDQLGRPEVALGPGWLLGEK